METATTCAWCGATLDEARGRLAGRARCATCGVATTDPWPSDADLDGAYAGWYRPAEGRFRGPGDALLRRTRGRLARRIDAIAPPGPVLDVGAGDGALLDALHAAGREATGLERESAREDVLDANVLEVEPAWAAIVFWHSLEHLRAPGAALDHAAGILVPGGVLAVAVPNASSLQARVFGDRWLALDLPRHLVHVPAPALRRRVEQDGLVVERLSHWRGGQLVFGWLHGLVGLLPGRPSLYDTIRRPQARSRGVSRLPGLLTIVAATALLPIAALGALVETALRQGGSIYLEARRA